MGEFTEFAHVRTECVNMATFTFFVCGIVLVGNYGARAIQGLAHAVSVGL